MFSRFAKIASTIPLFAHWGIVVALFFPRGALVFLRLVFLAAVASPPVLFSLGTDLFGWLSLAFVEAIVLGGFLRVQGYGSLFAERLQLALALTFLWAMVSPFGSPCAASAGRFRPFPMQQFVAERALELGVPGAPPAR